jgi:acyl dehydratase
VDASHRAVSTLEQANVTPGQQLDYLIMVAEARHNLVARLIDNHQPAQAEAAAAAKLDFPDMVGVRHRGWTAS